MSDMDPLYELMKDSAEDMSKAAVEMKSMMTADQNTDVSIEGYGAKPSFSKQLRLLTGENLVLNASSIADGLSKTVNGEYFRVPQGPYSDTAYIEYRNDNGVATAVMSVPGKQAVDNIAKHLTVVDTQIANNTQLSSLPLSQALSFTTVGNVAIDLGKAAMLRINAVKASATAANKVNLTYTQDGITNTLVTLLPNAELKSGKLTTPYRHLDLSGVVPVSVVLDASGFARAIYDSTVITLSGALYGPTIRSLFSDDDLFTPLPSGSSFSTTQRTCSLRDSTSLNLTFPYAEITAAGYPTTVAGVKAFIAAKYPYLKFRYYTGSNYSETTPLTVAAYLSASAASMTLSASDIQSINGEALTWNGVTVEDHQYNAFTRFIADVHNDTAYDYVNQLVELKVSFPQGLVFHHNAITVKDYDGNEFTAQFGGEDFVNLRFQSSEAFHADGSFKTGSIWFRDSIPTGTKKYYKVDVYSRDFDDTRYPDLAFDATNNVYSITVGDALYRFPFTTVYYGLASIDSAPYDGTKRNRVLISPVHWYLNGSSRVSEYFSNDVSLRVINSGPLFTEIERVGYNAIGAVYTDKALKSVTRFRIFTDGVVSVKNTITALHEIPVSTMLGARLNSRIFYKTGSGPLYSFSDTGLITSGNDAGNGKMSLVASIVNGDLHRDGVQGGPTRTWGTSITNSTSEPSLLVEQGWWYAASMNSDESYSFANWPVAANWTWSAEQWLNINETETATFTLATKNYNRPVGFAGEGKLPNYAIKLAEDRLKAFFEGVADFWMNGDTATIGGLVPPITYSNPKLPFGYFAYHELVKKGSVVSLANGFKSYLDTNYAGTGLGTAYLAGTRNIADLVTYVFKPMIAIWRVAMALGETSVTTMLQPYLVNVADAMVTAFNARGGIPNKYSDAQVNATNINIYGMLPVGLCIYAGLDTTGKYLTCFTDDIAMLTNSSATGGFRYAPTMLDAQPATTSLARIRWYNYDMDLAAEYAVLCDMINQTPLFNNANYGMHGLTGDGRMRTIDYLISESRRGIISTPVSVAVTMMMNRRVSTANALIKALDVFDKDYLTNPYDSIRLYDHDPRLASGMPTGITSHNRVLLEILAGYFINQIVKGKYVGG